MKTNKDRHEELVRDARWKWLIEEPEMARVFSRIRITSESEVSDSKNLDILEKHIKNIDPHTEMATVNGEDALIFFRTRVTNY